MKTGTVPVPATKKDHMTFDDLGLSPKVLTAINAAGFTEPTPIQSQGIPPALQGKDVLGLAQTGSGKTAAFALPMLTRLETGRARARPVSRRVSMGSANAAVLPEPVWARPRTSLP